MNITLESDLSFFQYIRTVHTVADCAFIENGFKSKIFTPKRVDYTTIHYFVSKLTAVMCALARDTILEHEYLFTFDHSASRI